MASSNLPPGRSPYPPSRSTRSRAIRLDSGLLCDDSSGAAASHSPFVQGLLRFSPSNASHHGASGWSPNNSNSCRVSASRPHPRFFEGADDLSEDGVPLAQLRALASQSLLQSSASQAVLFASVVFAKSQCADDALLLAHAQLLSGAAVSCLRTLEEAQLLQAQDPWDALLLATQALASADDWVAVAELIEDACRLPGSTVSRPIEDQDDIGWTALQQTISNSQSTMQQKKHHNNNNNNNNNHHYSSSTFTNPIHPLARLLLWRGRAYYETEHMLRAALFWKRALTIDCRCQEAWEALMSKHLLTPSEAFELIQDIDFATHDMEWLRSFYLASMELTPQDATLLLAQETTTTTTTASADNQAAGNQSFLSPINPALLVSPMPPPMGASATSSSSTIAMETPLVIGSKRSYQQSNRTNPSMHNQRDNNNNPGAASMASQLAQPHTLSSPIQEQVDQAFDKLWNVHKLQDSPHILAMAARRAYRQYQWKQALVYCQQLNQIDPVMKEAAYCYIATLVLLGHKRTLFRVAHEWVQAAPKSAQAWFAVGAYYYVCQRYHVAQRHFCRATRLDPQCTEAWIAFGCSFAASDESDQALASFRAAQRLSPGEHTSLLYMGVEYTRTNHLVLSGYFLQAALKTSGGDPLCLHELGVLALQKKEYGNAIQWFHRALLSLALAVSDDDNDTEDDNAVVTIEVCIEQCQDAYWEPTLFNLGHAFRKIQQFQMALTCFQQCVALCPDKFSPYAALGFTKHLLQDMDGAIEKYHQALSCKPDDPFSTELLNRALEDALRSGHFSTGIQTPGKQQPGVDEAMMTSPLTFGRSVGNNDQFGAKSAAETSATAWSFRDESVTDEVMMDESDDIDMSR